MPVEFSVEDVLDPANDKSKASSTNPVLSEVSFFFWKLYSQFVVYSEQER